MKRIILIFSLVCSFQVFSQTKCDIQNHYGDFIIIKKGEKIPCSAVSYLIGNHLTKAATICFSIGKDSENSCSLEAKANLDVPFFMAQMLKSSLQKFMDMLIDYIKEAAEKGNGYNL